MISSNNKNGSGSGGSSENGQRSEDGGGSNSSKRNNSSWLYRDLIGRLRALSFPDFRTCVLLWLGAKGFRGICVWPRSNAQGKRRFPSADFIAMSPLGRRVQTAIQIRHWRTSVSAKVVRDFDEFLLRWDIPEGLIISKSRFRSTAIRLSHQLPIRLCSIPQLAGSMAFYGLGVDPIGDGWQVSDSFFRTVRRVRLASSLSDQKYLKRSVSKRSAPVDVRTPMPPAEDCGLVWLLLLAALVALVILLLGVQR